jgi:hypothetical protein
LLAVGVGTATEVLITPAEVSAQAAVQRLKLIIQAAALAQDQEQVLARADSADQHLVVQVALAEGVLGGYQMGKMKHVVILPDQEELDSTALPVISMVVLVVVALLTETDAVVVAVVDTLVVVAETGGPDQHGVEVEVVVHLTPALVKLTLPEKLIIEVIKEQCFTVK